MNWQSGNMTNPADGSRNVVFRADTIVNVLSRLGAFLEKAEIRLGVESDVAQELAEGSLRDAASSSGADFADRLLDECKREGHELSERNRIREWCAFDSDVGFGLFECVFTPGTNIQGRADLRNSFANANVKHAANVVSFMSG